jgi:hypothetical protein
MFPSQPKSTPPAPAHDGHGKLGIWPRALIAGVIAWCVSIFWAAPSFSHLDLEWIKLSRGGDYLRLCADPFDRGLRETFLAYRVFPPFLAYLLGGGTLISLLLPYAATVVMLAVVFVAVARRLGTRMAWAGTLLIATTSAVTWPNCMVGYPDSFAHLFAALLILNRSRRMIFICVLCGLLSDERFILALPFVWLWHGGFRTDSGWRIHDLVTAGSALVVCLALRHGLRTGWIGPGIVLPSTYTRIFTSLFELKPYDQTWGMWWINVLGGFRWVWLFLVASAVLVWRKGEKANAVAYVAFLGAATLASLTVYDVTRSVGYSFTAVLVALVWFSESAREQSVRITGRLAALCFVTPSYWMTHDFFFWWWRPLPFRTYSILTGADPLAWFFR